MRTREAPASRAAKAAWGRIVRPAAPRDWLEALGLFVVFSLSAALILTAYGAGQMDWSFPGLREPRPLLIMALVVFIIPALGEELVFRNLLQPADAGAPAGLALSGLSLAAFIAWHPFQVWAGLPTAQPVFLDPAFLAVAALLGLVCTISAHRSGSIWPAVVIHWLVVVAWKAGGG